MQEVKSRQHENKKFSHSMLYFQNANSCIFLNFRISLWEGSSCIWREKIKKIIFTRTCRYVGVFFQINYINLVVEKYKFFLLFLMINEIPLISVSICGNEKKKFPFPPTLILKRHEHTLHQFHSLSTYEARN